MSIIEFNVPEGYVLDRKASTRNKVVYKMYSIILYLTFQASVNLDNLLKSRGICISLFNDQVRE